METTNAQPSRRHFLSLIPGVVGAASVASAVSVVAADDADAAAIKWPNIILASSLAVGASKSFTFNGKSQYAGYPGILYRVSKTAFNAYVAVCTHNGCTVSVSGKSIICPCHRGSFSLTSGAVTGGPPPRALYAAKVAVNTSGYVYWVKDL